MIRTIKFTQLLLTTKLLQSDATNVVLEQVLHIIMKGVYEILMDLKIIVCHTFSSLFRNLVKYISLQMFNAINCIHYNFAKSSYVYQELFLNI